MIGSTVRLLALASLACCAASYPLHAQQCPDPPAPPDPPDVFGKFDRPWEWDAQICANYVGGSTESSIEFYHAAVLTKGLHAGKVLLTRVDSSGPPDPQNGNKCGNTGKLQSWLFDPESPDVLIQVKHTLDVPGWMNCAGNAIDGRGRIVMVGGSTEPGDVPNKRVFRFDPDALGVVMPKKFEVGSGDTCAPRYVEGEAWSEIGVLHMGRYYATAVQATRVPIDHPGGCTNGIAGAMFTFGGPPHAGANQVLEGNEVWELLNPLTNQWACPIVPTEYPGTFQGPQGQPIIPERYKREPAGHDPNQQPNPLLDTYPRGIPLSLKAMLQIFIAGDSRTLNAGKPPTLIDYPAYQDLTGRETWTMKIPYAGLEPPQPEWELWTSPELNVERNYANVMLTFRQDDTGDELIHNRLLLLGGCEFVGGQQQPLNLVREYVPGADAASGNWVHKSSMLRNRHQGNSVHLPDGTILVIGGLEVFGSHEPPVEFVPALRPEIYDPGRKPDDLGSSTIMACNQQATWGAQSRLPRYYHSMALLLPDGRVLSVGGRHIGAGWSDPRLSGELFYPPYLFEGNQLTVRPVIDGVQTSHATHQLLSTQSTTRTFQLSVTPVSGDIEMVSAIRMSSVTHHIDTDQRYIELSFDPTVPGIYTELTVDAPQEDIAPQGYYYIFALERRGTRLIPSVAKIVQFL
jgi:hypothetical protein